MQAYSMPVDAERTRAAVHLVHAGHDGTPRSTHLITTGSAHAARICQAVNGQTSTNFPATAAAVNARSGGARR